MARSSSWPFVLEEEEGEGWRKVSGAPTPPLLHPTSWRARRCQRGQGAGTATSPWSCRPQRGLTPSVGFRVNSPQSGHLTPSRAPLGTPGTGKGVVTVTFCAHPHWGWWGGPSLVRGGLGTGARAASVGTSLLQSAAERQLINPPVMTSLFLTSRAAAERIKGAAVRGFQDLGFGAAGGGHRWQRRGNKGDKDGHPILGVSGASHSVAALPSQLLRNNSRHPK